MLKNDLAKRLWYVATNAAYRVHELLSDIRGVVSTDTDTQKLLSDLQAIKTSGRTDLSVWNEVMDIRNASFAGEYTGE